jgi:hypothetical protein
MRADTRSISIDMSPPELVRFLADPANLPRWAVGFAKSVRQEAGRWYVQTAGGEIALRIASDAASGVVDYWMSPAAGVEVMAASRVVPRGAGSEYVFTQLQLPGMSDPEFARSVQALQHELTVLKAIAEVDCPR